MLQKTSKSEQETEGQEGEGDRRQRECVKKWSADTEIARGEVGRR